jgi:hypothetical protein
MQRLWNYIIDEGEKQQSSIGRLASVCHIGDIGDSNFTLVLKNETIESTVKRGQEIIENLFREYTGTVKAMKTVLAKNFNTAGKASKAQSKQTKERTIEDIAHDAEDILGIAVEVK